MAQQMARWHLDIVDTVCHDRLVGSLGLGDSLAGAVRDVLECSVQPIGYFQPRTKKHFPRS
jgi:hypothetical protein